jgi:4-amino-4-deoxy-L-arabinose transferase-like glycosyltransferase
MGKIFKLFELRTPANIAWAALFFVAATLYLFGLNSPYAPTNGDEMVYIHIARMTAESGHWLPLQSELLGMRNTKPPLLIWQAMVAGDWGQSWSLFNLRLPSILYTFATTALLAFFTWHIAGQWRTACLAAVLYLLFYSSFRYGRAYLTSAPETFWLALPMWWVLWLRLRQMADTTAQIIKPGWLVYTLLGVAMGLGAAYKSFALLAPTAAAVWCALLLSYPEEPRWSWRRVLNATSGLGWSLLVGLAIFALWFVLDPDPAAVWQEFVIAENAGKMSNSQGYWHAAFFGTYPMWTQLLAYPENAGLLAFPALGFCWWAVSCGIHRKVYAQLSPAHWILLAWLAVWLIVFTIPSQRSARYVIPAMPALAIAMALVWERIAKGWFLATLLITAPALVLLARIAWVMGEMGMSSPLEVAMTLVAACAGLAGVVAGFVYISWARNATLVACLAVYGTFGLMVEPISHTATDYTPEVRAAIKGHAVAVPNGFTGQYERFHFVFDGARITPYDAEGKNSGGLYPQMPPVERLSRLLNEFDAVVWLQDTPAELQPSCVPQCRVIGQRWHVKSRHKGGEITLGNLWYPQQWLFRREWLIVRVP